MIRSLLYVPASSERFIAKAHDRGADAVILDLEDSVASSEKEKARAALAATVPAVSRNGAKVFVRINSEADLMFADSEAACRAGAFGLFVPKSRRPNDLVRLAASVKMEIDSEGVAIKLRDACDALLAAADDAIAHALSQNSAEFLAQSRQMGGQ